MLPFKTWVNETLSIPEALTLVPSKTWKNNSMAKFTNYCFFMSGSGMLILSIFSIKSPHIQRAAIIC